MSLTGEFIPRGFTSSIGNMNKLGRMLTVLAVGAAAFCVAAALAYVVLWHLAGLSSLSKEDSMAAAGGAFSVVVKSLLIGVIAGISAALPMTLFLFRKALPRPIA